VCGAKTSDTVLRTNHGRTPDPRNSLPPPVWFADAVRVRTDEDARQTHNAPDCIPDEKPTGFGQVTRRGCTSLVQSYRHIALRATGGMTPLECIFDGYVPYRDRHFALRRFRASGSVFSMMGQA